MPRVIGPNKTNQLWLLFPSRTLEVVKLLDPANGDNEIVTRCQDCHILTTLRLIIDKTRCAGQHYPWSRLTIAAAARQGKAALAFNADHPLSAPIQGNGESPLSFMVGVPHLTLGKESTMNGIRRKGGRKPVSLRPDIPAANYHDEITPAAFEKLRRAVEELNVPGHKRCLVDGVDWYPVE